MRRNMLNKLAVVFFITVLFSCKAKKQMVATALPVKDTTTNAAAPVTTNAKLTAIRSGQLGFNTFSGRGHAKLDLNGNSNDVTLNIRINSGKKIWVSVTAVIGIEVARALITPDSIIVINKLQGLYIKQPFSYIYTFTGKQVNYQTIESLLIGNAVPEALGDNALLQPNNGNIDVSGNIQDLLYKLTVRTDYKVTSMNLSNQGTGQSLQVTNSGFMQVGNRLIPAQIDINSMVKGQQVQLNLHYAKVDFDQPQDYPFNIPARYSPQN